MSRKRVLIEAADVEESVATWIARYEKYIPFNKREDAWNDLWKLLDSKKVTYDVKREAAESD